MIISTNNNIYKEERISIHYWLLKPHSITKVNSKFLLVDHGAGRLNKSHGVIRKINVQFIDYSDNRK